MRLWVDVAEHPHSQHKRSGSLLLTNEGSRAPRQMSRGGKDGTRMFSLMGDTPVEKRKGKISEELTPSASAPPRAEAEELQRRYTWLSAEGVN